MPLPSTCTDRHASVSIRSGALGSVEAVPGQVTKSHQEVGLHDGLGFGEGPGGRSEDATAADEGRGSPDAPSANWSPAGGGSREVTPTELLSNCQVARRNCRHLEKRMHIYAACLCRRKETPDLEKPPRPNALRCALTDPRSARDAQKVAAEAELPGSVACDGHFFDHTCVGEGNSSAIDKRHQLGTATRVRTQRDLAMAGVIGASESS